jgi:hypothetical protein
LDDILFNYKYLPYKEAIRDRELPISFSDGFEFCSIVGSGFDTPLHVVFNKPISNFSELKNIKPNYVMADGDGTVLTTSALSDGYPDEIVVERRTV